jgi:hypothetical protein
MAVLTDDAVGVDGAFALRFPPFQVARTVPRVMSPGVEDDIARVLVDLIYELVLAGGVPEGLRIGFGESRLWSWHG